MIIKFPELLIRQRIGSRTKKNDIVHLAIPYQELKLEIINAERTSITLKDKLSKQYLITSNQENISNEYDLVALAKKFTQTNIQNGEITILKWLKHPDLREHNPQEITESWLNKFTFKKEDISKGLLGLRTPQVGAIHALLAHLTNAKEVATIVLPTGTGKTDVMISVLVANQCNKLLVTVPSDSLRSQLAEKFKTLGLLLKPDINGQRILNPEAKFPIIGILNTGFQTMEELKEFCSKCNVIVTTMNLVADCPPEQKAELSDICSHLFVDEAHHAKAGNWNKFINKFNKNKIIQFTATPYRNDGKLLDGKIIYNFTLKEAQEQGYFQEIDFIPIRIYEQKEADQKIAEIAVNRLRNDLANDKDHLLMARCETKARAEEVFKIYQHYEDLNPAIIHSTVKGKNQLKRNIINKRNKIIVCVDMLGEGFDLPELKIAAFHDIRKSLPITLQFTGRFTRTSRDANLGNASFIANLYQPDIDDEIGLLYAKESNWNTILPQLSQQTTQQQIDLQEFLSDFENLEQSIIPYQDIKPAFSIVAYINNTNEWNPNNFDKGIKGFESYDYKFHDINRNKNTLIIFLGNKNPVDWGNFKDVYNIEWEVFIIYWEIHKNILFIHSSEKGSEYKELAKAIIGDDAELIRDENVFRSFYNLDRIKLYNVGLRKGLGKDISFQSYYGKGVQDALSLSEEKSGVKNNVFGVGFEKGEITSMGCSRSGRIWSYSRGTINNFINWCNEVSNKLSNKDIDPEEILLINTIKPKKLSVRPDKYPIAVDWNAKIYKEPENRTTIYIQNQEYDLSNTELNVVNPTFDQDLQFSIETLDGKSIVFNLQLSVQVLNQQEVFDYNISKITNTVVQIKLSGQAIETIEEYFNKYAPIFWFADGSNLQGYEYVEYNEEIQLYPKQDIIEWDWEGVNLNEESEKFDPIVTTSIQHYCIQKFLNLDYDIIFNDDEKGEIADIITIKNNPESIEVELYHLKFAYQGRISNQIRNFYEVCGQAQKSLRWKWREGGEFINHLIRREYLKQQINQTRLKKGTLEDLEKLLGIIKWTKPVNFEIYIVQPALSKQDVSNDILHLLGVSANHIKKEGNLNLKVIGNNKPMTINI